MSPAPSYLPACCTDCTAVSQCSQSLNSGISTLLVLFAPSTSHFFSFLSLPLSFPVSHISNMCIYFAVAAPKLTSHFLLLLTCHDNKPLLLLLLLFLILPLSYIFFFGVLFRFTTVWNPLPSFFLSVSCHSLLPLHLPSFFFVLCYYLS